MLIFEILVLIIFFSIKNDNSQKLNISIFCFYNNEAKVVKMKQSFSLKSY